MPTKIAIAVVHGVGKQTADFSKEMEEELSDRFAKEIKVIPTKVFPVWMKWAFLVLAFIGLSTLIFVFIQLIIFILTLVPDGLNSSTPPPA